MSAVIVIESVVNQEVNDYWNVARLLGSASDWKAMLADHSDAIAHAFDSGNATSREAGLNWLEGQEFDFTPVLKSVAGMAVGTSKKLRPVARKVLRNYLSDSNAIIVDLLHNGKAGERGFAAEAVAELYPEDAAGILEEAAKTEKSKRVLQTIELQLAGCSGASTGGEDVEEIDLPPIEVPTGVLPLPPGSAEAIKAQIGLAFDKLEEQYVKDKANYKVGDRSGYHRKPQQPKRMPDKEINGVIAFIEGRTDEMFSLVPSAVRALSILPDWSTWEGFKLDQLHLVHVVRFMFVMRIFQVQHGGFYSHSESWLNSHRATLDAPYGLRELDATMAATLSEVEEGKVAESYLQMNTAWRKFLDWEPDAVWPLFQQCSNLLRDSILGVAFESGYYAGEARVTALKIVCTRRRENRS